jgi:signal transduction histidine kinase
MEERNQDQPTTRGLEFLGAVAGGLVHEIRNPLSAMSMTLQLLEEEWPEDQGDARERRTARRLRTLRQEVSRLSSILDDFLRYAGIRRLDLREADLNRVVEEVVSFMAPECARGGIEISLFPDRLLPLLPLDERLVKQALLNLLLNAVQAMEAMEPGPDGALAPRQLIVHTGPGIPEAWRERVWQVYFSRKKGGSGLGLPTARRIAEEHAGSLVFETAEGKGTDFVLRLPLAGPPRDDRP